jgi:hypothetical protein
VSLVPAAAPASHPPAHSRAVKTWVVLSHLYKCYITRASTTAGMTQELCAAGSAERIRPRCEQCLRTCWTPRCPNTLLGSLAACYWEQKHAKRHEEATTVFAALCLPAPSKSLCSPRHMPGQQFTHWQLCSFQVQHCVQHCWCWHAVCLLHALLHECHCLLDISRCCCRPDSCRTGQQA